MFLEHANLTVRDLDRSIEFYCTLLDGTVRWRGENAAGRSAAHVGSDAHYISLFQASEESMTDPQPELDTARPGFNHLGFIVEDMDVAIERLRIMGVTPKSDDSYDPGRQVYFLDPDGLEIELVQYSV